MEKPTIKINYVDFYPSYKKDDNHTYRLLCDHYNVEFSDKPDYLLFSCFGNTHANYTDCIKIFWTCECVQPNFTECDYAIGYDRISFGDRYIRTPLYVLYTDMYELAKHKHEYAEQIFREKRDFCSFTVSNKDGMPERENFFRLLGKYKKVDAGGGFLNNIGGPVKNKLEFDKKHKFSITFENIKYKGYTTEKIVDAFAAGCIPIYLGDEDVTIDINPKAFINGHDYATLDELCEAVKKVDEDDELYLSMLKEPVFTDAAPKIEDYDKFILSIFRQDKSKARRRPYNRYTKLSDRPLQIANRFEPLMQIKRKIINLFKKS